MKILKNRTNIIKCYVKGRNVLDLGAIAHESEREKESKWLHRIIKQHAKNTLGVDFEKGEVEKLNKLGYDMIYGDVQNFNLNKKFEVIVAGELIEHLTNVGLFLDCCKKHMDEDSVLIITTPNAFAIRRVFRNFIFGFNPNTVNHTCYYDVSTLKQTFKYANLKIVELHYFFDSTKPSYKYWIEKTFSFIRPVFTPNIIFILKK